MLHYCSQCFLYTLPILLSGILFIIVLKKNYFKILNNPIDFNKNIFGKNKTFRGFILMPVFCLIVTSILYFLVGEANELYKIGNLHKSLILGFSYSLGELPNSFIKRRCSIPPGKKAEKNPKKTIFLVLDNIDSIVSCCFCLVLFYQIDLTYLIGILILGSAIHLSTDFLLFKIGIKPQP
ncbi:MAG: CDP-archaeol synthase [Candidatus Pacebacteria bacterium]|nr:CDP-archaeol synthase [Candidatus Paceibacterota bacterium]